MLWLRVAPYRLESEPPGFTIETYHSPRSSSTHVRKNGRLMEYVRDEAAGIKFVKDSTVEIPT
jgi:hypothetical protein